MIIHHLLIKICFITPNVTLEITAGLQVKKNKILTSPPSLSPMNLILYRESSRTAVAPAPSGTWGEACPGGLTIHKKAGEGTLFVGFSSKRES